MLPGQLGSLDAGQRDLVSALCMPCECEMGFPLADCLRHPLDRSVVLGERFDPDEIAILEQGTKRAIDLEHVRRGRDRLMRLARKAAPSPASRVAVQGFLAYLLGALAAS